MKKSRAVHLINTVQAEIHVDSAEVAPERNKPRHTGSGPGNSQQEQLVKEEAEVGNKAEQQKHGTTFVIGAALTQTRGHRERLAADIQPTTGDKHPGMNNIEVFGERTEVTAKRGGHKLMTAIQRLATASTSRKDNDGSAHMTKTLETSSEKKSETKRTVTVATYVMRQMKTQQMSCPTGCVHIDREPLKEQQVNTDSGLMKQSKKIMPNQFFNKLRKSEAIPTYEVRQNIRKSKHVYKSCIKREHEGATTSGRPMDTHDNDSLKPKRKNMSFYKATCYDKPGDFLLQPRAGRGPSRRSPHADTQTDEVAPAVTTPEAPAKKQSASARRTRTVTVANYVMSHMKTNKEQVNWITGCDDVTGQKTFEEQRVNMNVRLVNKGQVITSHEAVESLYWDRYRKYDLKTRYEEQDEEECVMVPRSELEKHKEKTIREVFGMYEEPDVGMEEDIMKNLKFEGALPRTGSGHWTRQDSQHFDNPKTFEAMPTYMLGKIIKKTKHVYKKYRKRDAVQHETETTGDRPKEIHDEDSLNQQREVNFYRATRSDKPGDFLLHTRGDPGPTRGPEAETQTETRTDSSSDEEYREQMQQMTEQEKWEICEKQREEQISQEKEKDSKQSNDKELKENVQHPSDKQEQPLQDEQQHSPQQQVQETPHEQIENIGKTPDVDENQQKAPKVKKKVTCEVPPAHTTTTAQRANVDNPLVQSEIQEKQELQGKLKTLEVQEQRDAQDVAGSQTSKTPEPKNKETLVYQEQTASIHNVQLQRKIHHVPGKTEAQVYLGKLWKFKKLKSVDKGNAQNFPEPETQKLIDTIEVKRDTQEHQQQLGTPEQEKNITPDDDLRDPSTVRKTKKKLYNRKLQENMFKGKGNNFLHKVKKKKNTSKAFKDKMMKPLPVGAGDEDVYTGLLQGGARRVDLVLVMTATDSDARENTKLQLLGGLVEMGITLEAEVGLLPENQNIMFIKLYAPDDALCDYAEALRIQKYFQSSHENFISEKITLLDEKFKLQHEREWLKSVRRRHAPPLRYSCQERSHVVLMMLRHHCAALGPQLHRFLNTRILLDVYALHDGPYYCPYQNEFYTFNCRQVLFLHWAGKHNMLKYQPLHMIYDYFGSKLAFYFLFYGFYNMALIFASIWGVFMTLVYLIKDHDYLQELRDACCTTYQYDDVDEILKLKRMGIYAQACFQCEGESDRRVCAGAVLQDRCTAARIMTFTDNPYMVLYSAGIALWALLFLTFWKRTERYWLWMWEENLASKHQLFGSIGGAESLKMNGFKKKNNTKERLANRATNVLVALAAVVALVVLMVVAVVVVYAGLLQPLAVYLWSFKGRNPSKHIPEMPKVYNALETCLLILLACCTLAILFVLEKSLHRVSWTLTSLEGHLSFERFEKSLISKYFFYSFVFTSSLVVCFGWLKGVFHSGNMLDTWDIKLNISTPWSTYNVAAPLRSIIRRAVTLNCPFFSCFYEGVVVFVTTILFRDVLVRVVTIIRSRGRGAKEEQQAAGAPVSTCEREYRLPPVTDQQVVDDFNTLFLQLALVTLFAPMFPLAPLLALAVNSLDMRSKASMYTTRHRRALLFRSAGIGYWNHVLKLVCYAAPLFHALTWTRTQIFKKYMCMKINRDAYLYRMFQPIKHLITITYFKFAYLIPSRKFDYVMTTHAEYIQTNKDRIYNQYNKSFAYWFNTSATYLMSHRSDGCKTSTYLTSIYYDYEIMTIDDRGHEWPHQWNHLGENYTGSTTTPTYYFLQNFKFICILLYIIVFAALAVAVWQAVRGCPGAVARRQQRERVLRRWHQHRLPSLRRRFP